MTCRFPICPFRPVCGKKETTQSDTTGDCFSEASIFFITTTAEKLRVTTTAIEQPTSSNLKLTSTFQQCSTQAKEFLKEQFSAFERSSSCSWSTFTIQLAESNVQTTPRRRTSTLLRLVAGCKAQCFDFALLWFPWREGQMLLSAT